VILARNATSTLECPCGCGQSLRAFDGELEIRGQRLSFTVQLRDHGDDGRVAWMAVITGPWHDEDRLEGAWVTLRARVHEGQLQTRTVDPALSPFREVLEPRPLHAVSAADVEGRPGARDYFAELALTLCREPEVYGFLVTPA
jgi:hypothetical protein